MYSIIISAVISIAVFVYFKIWKSLKYWKRMNIPYEEPWPILGNMGPVAFRTMSLAELVLYWCKKNSDKSYFGVHQFLNPTLVVQNPELIKEIAVKHFDAFTDHHDFIPSDSDPFWNKNLLTMKGENWRSMRAVLSPAFTSSKMKFMFCLMVDCARNFVDHLDSSNGVIVMEMKECFMKFANDVIASAAFGVQIDSVQNPNNQFYSMGRKSFDFKGLKSLKFFAYSISPWLTRVLRIKFLDDDVKSFFRNIIGEVLNQRKKTNIIRPDMIHLLREAQKGRLKREENSNVAESSSTIREESNSEKKNKDIITDDDIAAQAVLFYFGGFDTVTVLMTHAVYELATNPDVQEKLIREVDETLKNCDGKITYDALMQMKYLDMIISETLRLWDPAPIANRIATKSITLKVPNTNEPSVHIEKGTSVWFPIYAIHRNPKFYENPSKFDPERFNDENKENIASCTYLPFGVGPRQCIGNRFALLETKAVLFFMLTKFEFIPVEKSQVPLKLSKSKVTIDSETEYWFGLKPRNK